MSTNPQAPLIPAAAGSGPMRLLVRYGPWILLVTLIVTGAAFGAAQLVTPKFVSAANVVVEPRVFANTTPLQPDMGTEKQVAQSGVVLEPAAEKLGVGLGELDEGLAITVTPDANVLVFTYTHVDAVQAQRRAEAVAEGYVRYRNIDASRTEGVAKPTLQATLVTKAALPKPVGRPTWRSTPGCPCWRAFHGSARAAAEPTTTFRSWCASPTRPGRRRSGTCVPACRHRPLAAAARRC
jgi:hypothetical protein